MTDLQPDKKLLNNNFDGYKLSSDDLNVLSLPLVFPLNGTEWKQPQYSYAHIKSHEMHNHLYGDHFSNNFYFTDENLAINVLNEEEKLLYEVFKIPKPENIAAGAPFSESLTFPSEIMAVLCDGYGSIYLINTGTRTTKEQKWNIITNNSIHNLKAPALLLSTVMVDKNTVNILSLSLKDIKQLENTTTKVVLHWLQVHVSSEEPVECSVKGIKVFLGKNIPYAHWFDEDFMHLFTAAESAFYLVDGETFETIEPLLSIEKDNTVDKYYRWHQNKELVSITFDFHVTEKEVDIEMDHNSIRVNLSNGKKILLAGDLEQEIIVDASRWFVEKNRLEVNLIKKTPGPFWTSVIKDGDKHGVHDILGEEEENINYVNESLAHLTSDGTTREEKEACNFNLQQLEECDRNVDEDIKLFSLNVFTGKVTTLKHFTGHHWLFTKTNGVEQAPLICLRHDVDGVLWQSSRKLNGIWEHIATFDALGYVQASKENHKFTTCDESFKYAFITDCTSHVYIYEGSSKEDKKQHKQFVNGFPDCEKIMGCQALSNKFCVLTDKHINVIQLP